MRHLIAAALLVVPSALHAQLTDTQAMNAGRRYVQFFLNGDADSLAAVMTPEAMTRIGGTTGITMRANAFKAQLGVEEELLKEEVVREGGTMSYIRLARFTAMRTPMRITWTLDGTGRIVSGEMTNEQPD